MPLKLLGVGVQAAMSIPIGPNVDEISDSIRDPEGSGPMRRAVGFLGRQICDAIGAVEDWVNDAGVPVRNFIPACRGYWDDNGQSGPIAEQPFEGGQCNDLYRAVGTVTYDRVFCQTGQVVPIVGEAWATEFSLQGPIEGVSARVVQPGACGALSWGLFAQTVTGEQLLVQILGFSNVFNSQNISYTLAFERAGGQPDNCGNPAPVIRPGPNPTPTPPEVLPPEDRPFEDPITGPSIRIPTIPTIPGLPDLPGFDPFGGAGGSGGGPDDDPGDIGEPSEPEDTEPGGEASGCAPPNSVLVGLKVTIVSTPPLANQYDPKVWRGACYVYMGVEDTLGLDPTGVALRNNQFFYAQKDNLTCWLVSANVGFNLRVTPYYRELEAEQV